MYVPFNTYSKAVKKENLYLLHALGSIEGRAKYQWAWSEDLQLPMVGIDDEGHIVYDYHCICGVNRTVHSAVCNFTTPHPKWALRPVLDTMRGRWVLVRWSPPEVPQDEWEACFGGIPYPEGGYFKPVGTATQCIAVFGEPFHQTTQEVVAKIREHFSITEKQRNDETRQRWAEADRKKREEHIQRFTDAFPVHTGYAGKKEEWSGQAGLGESPTLLRLQGEQ